jgi:hypothetical protein
MKYIRSTEHFHGLKAYLPIMGGAEMKYRAIRMLLCVVAGLAIIAGTLWLLSRTLGDHPALYAGRPLDEWVPQLTNQDATISNQANDVLNSQIIPRLVDQMFHDTNDSQVRIVLVQSLNRIPGLRLNYSHSASRRIGAEMEIGNCGPPAKAAVPSLIQALEGSQEELHEAAIQSLGKIHANPDLVIPLLIPCLTNNDLNEDAAIALANYGPVAKAVFPNLLPLLKAGDPHTRKAARFALKRIDPEAAAKAGVDKIRVQ